MSEMQHQLTLKDIQIAQLWVAARVAQSGPRRRTSISRPVDYGDEMSRAQRVILELQNQVTNLRAGISTATSTMEVALRAQKVPQAPSDGSMSQEMELRSPIQLPTLSWQTLGRRRNRKGTS
jgi:hypothetical protein